MCILILKSVTLLYANKLIIDNTHDIESKWMVVVFNTLLLLVKNHQR